MENEKQYLIAFMNPNIITGQMKPVDIWQEAGLSHVCNGTVLMP